MKKPLKILGAVAIAAGFAFTYPNYKKAETITVVIDAAHGGKDYGAVYNGFTEKNIAAAVADKIQELNADADVTLHITRVDDIYVSLEDRVKAINMHNPDLVLSLHTNFEKEGNKSGIELFVSDKYPTYEKSKAYADRLSEAFKKQQHATAVKTAPMYLLKNSQAPAIIFEMGYLSSESDRGYLTTPNGQEAIAQTVVDFIKDLK